jgi:hypothetical protein
MAKIDWKLVGTFDSFGEAEQYFERGRPRVKEKSNKTNCTVCNNNDGHKMKVQYMKCNRDECNGDCKTRYKMMHCVSKSVLYSFDEHEIATQITQQTTTQTIKIKRGISHSTKESIETILNDKNVRVPKKIFIELATNKTKYNISYLPSLIQIQNYLKYRRTRCGDINSINGVEEFVNGYPTVDQLGSSEPVFFGAEYGNGTDENHFHLGVTSKSLLENIHKSEIFHIDATYKIIKYNFPLIVFGCTDVRRQFHLISFMITSHETENDYHHFFSSMIDLCSKLDIILTPKYMVQDADQAMANAVMSSFPECSIIMCYFHVKLNVNILN